MYKLPKWLLLLCAKDKHTHGSKTSTKCLGPRQRHRHSRLVSSASWVNAIANPAPVDKSRKPKRNPNTCKIWEYEVATTSQKVGDNWNNKLSSQPVLYRAKQVEEAQEQIMTMNLHRILANAQGNHNRTIFILFIFFFFKTSVVQIKERTWSNSSLRKNNLPAELWKHKPEIPWCVAHRTTRVFSSQNYRILTVNHARTTQK